MNTKRRNLEQHYGFEFAKATGVNPLIEQLVKLDKVPALRYLVTLRRILYNYVLHAEKTFGAKNNIEISTPKLLGTLNEIIYTRGYKGVIEFKENKKEAEGLISVIYITMFAFIIEELQLSSEMQTKMKNELE